jgi:phenylacetic acid degradation operon negative regulatory protein
LSGRSMIFTLYGAYIRNYGHRISNQSLSSLMAVFDFSPEAVRAAAFRMVNQGWLQREREGRNTYFTLTQAGQTRVRQGVLRIFEIDQSKWDGTWYLLTYAIPESRRNLRDELRRELKWFGFETISNGTWITPWNLLDIVQPFIEKHHLTDQVAFFSAQLQGFNSAHEIVARCWNLSEIAYHYYLFIEKWEPIYHNLDELLGDPMKCFREQMLIIHDWRKFLHLDPKLPFELLPEDWIGRRALDLFNTTYKELSTGAIQYLEHYIDPQTIYLNHV